MAEAAREYHARTKHSYASVRASARYLDWENRPNPFKDYPDLEPLPLTEGSDLGWLLRWGAGVIRTRSYGTDTYYFRTYSSAGALYPVEVNLASEDGVFHFHPRELALRRLRSEDVRRLLVEDAESVLVLTGILWRTAWKYEARGYRHLWWDAGTMLANFLALAAAAGLRAHVVTGFVDADVNRLVGADGEREVALALLALGEAEPTASLGELEPLVLESPPLSPRELSYPEAHRYHAASSLASEDEVRHYRQEGQAKNLHLGLGREELERVLRRRGSVREFSLEAVPRAELAGVLSAAAAPIPADVPPYAETYLIVNAIDGLASGSYRFSPPDEFELLREGSFRREAGYLALEQPLGARAAATIFFLTDLERIFAAHGDRGYRWAQLEGGIRTGRVYLGAYARGLAATASTFYDDEVTEFFAPGTAKAPMLCVAVGRR